MRITEIFHSVQGEGAETGLPTIFVRTTGCHLRCVWCDSEYAFHGGEDMSIDRIMDHLERWPTKRVCFTGGEPLLQKEARDFVARLIGDGYDVVIETSGSLELDDYVTMEPRERLTLSVDVKCPGSGMDDHNELGELKKLAPHDQVKFVIRDEVDYEFAKDVLATTEVPCGVVFQPVWGETDPQWLADSVLDDGLDVRLSLQVHKYIWGDKPGH